ncbi:rubrerythrin family protein [bacterium]|nr:rubrerythrin family protein [bacterium]
MKKLMSLCMISSLLLAVASLTMGEEVSSAQAGSAQHKLTLLQYLQTANKTEAYESVLYANFAAKADQEGYGQVASLFRALSKAEAIHAANKATLIDQLGGTLEPPQEAFSIGTTTENLDWALNAEQHENEAMYADYAKQARKLKDSQIAKSFEYCLAAEPWHVHILKQARNNIGDYAGVNIDFHVCADCGNTVRSLSFEKCGVCGLPKDSFVAVR